MLEYTRAGDGARLMMLVLHDDAEREYADGPARELPDTKVGTFTQAHYDEAMKDGSSRGSSRPKSGCQRQHVMGRCNNCNDPSKGSIAGIHFCWCDYTNIGACWDTSEKSPGYRVAEASRIRKDPTFRRR
jgi:hypothetical protein